MKLINKSKLEVKNSKFYGYYYEIDKEEDVKKIIEELKKEHKKSDHIPYAYKLGIIERKFEDKEPSCTAGLPLLALINKKKLDNTLLVVVRYFGGVKLGSGGLYIAYMKAATLCFDEKKAY